VLNPRVQLQRVEAEFATKAALPVAAKRRDQIKLMATIYLHRTCPQGARNAMGLGDILRPYSSREIIDDMEITDGKALKRVTGAGDDEIPAPHSLPIAQSD
jgi:hypothetical protein